MDFPNDENNVKIKLIERKNNKKWPRMVITGVGRKKT